MTLEVMISWEQILDTKTGDKTLYEVIEDDVLNGRLADDYPEYNFNFFDLEIVEISHDGYDDIVIQVEAHKVRL